MTGQKPVTIGDVAELRAYARQVKMYYGKTLDVDDAREVIREVLEDHFPVEMLDLLALCADPDFIEAVTGRAIADYHAKGDL